LESGRSYGALIANWDGQWYKYIVEHGYPHHLPTVHGVVQDNQWAFYPLYPALLRAMTWTGTTFAVAASLVSITFGALAMCLLYRMLVAKLGVFGASMSVLTLCVAPPAVIWQAAYTESLALFLVLAALIALRSRRYGAFLTVALALSLTRPIVLPLAVVAVIHWYGRWRAREEDPFPRIEQVRAACATLMTAASFLVWPLVAAIVTGRRDAYFATQRAWLSNDANGWPNWFLVAIQASTPALMVLVPLALMALTFLVLRKAGRKWGLELRAWGLMYPLYLLGSTTPTTSIFRYAMLSVIPWWPIPEAGDHVELRRHRWSLAALVVVVGVCMQLAWMRWLFVVSPATLERP
jgi:hypothetical protein